jgi:hypothetical protein
LLDLLSSSAKLKVNEGAEYSDPDTGETFKEDPTFSGERAKLFGFIPYGADPSEAVKSQLAYEQISGSAADKRKTALQKILGTTLNDQAVDLAERTGAIALKNKLEEETGIAALKRKQAEFDAFKEENKQRLMSALKINEARKALKLERKNADFAIDKESKMALAKHFGSQGAGMDPANIQLGNEALQTARRNEILAGQQTGTLMGTTFDDRAAATQDEAARAAAEARFNREYAQSKQGRRSMGIGQTGRYSKQGAEVMALARERLGPGDTSVQPLEPLFGPYANRYEYGAAPIKKPVMMTIIGKDGRPMQVPTGETTTEYQFSAGQADPATIRRAARNVNRGQRSGGAGDGGVPAALVPPTPAAAAAQPQVSPEERLSPSLMQQTGNFGFNQQNPINPLNALRGLYNSSAYVAQGLKSGAEELGGGLQSVLQGENPYTIPPSQEHMDVLQRIKARNDANRRRKKSKQ